MNIKYETPSMAILFLDNKIVCGNTIIVSGESLFGNENKIDDLTNSEYFD